MSERRAHSAIVTWRVAVNSPLSGLSAKAKHVGLSLANYMSEAGDSAYPSPETLREDSGLAVSTVREGLRELRESGWAVLVNPGGGRGRTNEWATAIPDSFWQSVEGILGRETRRDTAAFRAARAALRAAARGAQEASLGTPQARSTEVSTESETRRAAEGLPDEKPAGGATETRRERLENPPPTGTEVEDLEGAKKEQQQSAEVVDAAAAALDRDLRRHRVAGDVRALALLDPERTRAWLDVAAKEASRNVGGFLATQIRSGEWPSPRGDEISADRRHAARVESLRTFVAGDMVDEAHELVDDWTTLTQVERNEYHSLVDELASEQLPEAAPAEAVRGAA